jgi:hypothetical protein
MSQRSNCNATGSQTVLNKNRPLNQIKKNDLKSKSDNNFYSNKNRRID